ncbi:hypothetical protein OAG71_01635 [bacterium]|nr:hypothetical protein [bacterium]
MTAFVSPSPPNATPERQIPNADLLYRKHLELCKAGCSPDQIVAMFCDDLWFCKQLRLSAIHATRKIRGLPVCKDDIRQQAIVNIFRSLQRKTDLGFDPQRGTYAAFLGTILNRACQKVLSQFRHTYHLPIKGERHHPVHDPTPDLQSKLDLQEQIQTLDQPVAAVIKELCDGKKIKNIAVAHRISRRTVYRRLEKGISQLREKLS